MVLPDLFAVIFDGTIHFIGVFATFPSDNKDGFAKVLLGISPIADESTHDAGEHQEFLDFVLSIFEKGQNNVVTLIADNTNTNRDCPRYFGEVFVGCHSHRFTLVVKDFLVEVHFTIDKVNQLIKRLSYSILSSLLQMLTPLSAKTSNAIRLNSTYQMLDRCKKYSGAH